MAVEDFVSVFKGQTSSACGKIAKKQKKPISTFIKGKENELISFDFRDVFDFKANYTSLDIHTNSHTQIAEFTKSVRVYWNESYKMMKMYLKIQDVFTRPSK